MRKDTEPTPSDPGSIADEPKSLTNIADESGGASAIGEAVAASENMSSQGIGRFRWTICTLLFFATTINYLDRQVLGILAPTLEKDIGWNEKDYGNIVLSFQAAYAIGLLAAGAIMDKIGTRLGYAVSISMWSLAAMGHALANSVGGFSVARFALGLGEAGNFPAAIKTVSEWFPKRDRATVTGIFNAGSNVGAIIAPLSVPFITLTYGWRTAFVITGGVGFIWLIAWWLLYRRPEEHPRVSPQELAYIRSDPPESMVKVPWSSLLGHRQMWAFALGKLLTDPVWWFYLYWLGKFLKTNFGIELKGLALPLVVIYLVADVGSIVGGWLSSAFIKRGMTVNAGRKLAMLICALCVVPVPYASQTDNLWVAVGLISLAAAAHQGWSANLFTMVSDMYPRRAVGSVVGMGGMAGALGGMAAAWLTGKTLQDTNSNYVPVLLVCGFAYLLALGIIHLLAPKLQGPDLSDETGA
jgi:ACS family hexuronate transporter-like MFS transporter